MLKSRFVHILLCFILVLTHKNSFTLNPGQRAAIQDLTKKISNGLEEEAARKRAIALKIPKDQMNDPIIQDLIMAADEQDITNIFDAGMVTTKTAKIKAPKVIQTPEPTIAKPKIQIQKPAPTSEVTEKALPELLQLKKECKQLETTLRGDLSADQVKELRSLSNKYSDLALKFSQNYTYTPQEIALQKEIEDLLLKLRGKVPHVQIQKPTITPAPTGAFEGGPNTTQAAQLSKAEIDAQFNAILDPLRTEVRDAYAKLDKDIENQLKDKPNVNDGIFRAFDKKRAEIENREHALQLELANFAKYQPQYIGLESASTKNLTKEMLALSDSVYDKLKKLRIILQENIEQLKATFAQEKTPTTTVSIAPQEKQNQATLITEIKTIINQGYQEFLKPINERKYKRASDFQKLVTDKIALVTDEEQKEALLESFGTVYPKIYSLMEEENRKKEQSSTTRGQAPTSTAVITQKGQYEQELSDIIRKEEAYITQLQDMVDGKIALDSNILSDKTFNQVMNTPVAEFKRKVGPNLTFTEKENDLTKQHPENYQKANNLRIKAFDMMRTQQAPQPTQPQVKDPLRNLQSEINKNLQPDQPEARTLQKAFGEHHDFKPLPGKTITLDVKHIFGISLSEPPIVASLTLRGLHHDLNNDIQKKGIIVFGNIKNSDWGAYSAELSYNGKQIGSKNFFPAGWSREKVVRAIREAYDDFVKRDAKIESQTGHSFTIRGKSADNKDIIMVVDKGDGRIISAYPAKI